jgi:hypothetical protein
MEKPMIELLIAACLASGDCREVSLLYDPREVTLLTCLVSGHAEVARWQARHPDWRVERWRCGLAGERGRQA